EIVARLLDADPRLRTVALTLSEQLGHAQGNGLDHLVGKRQREAHRGLRADVWTTPVASGREGRSGRTRADKRVDSTSKRASECWRNPGGTLAEPAGDQSLHGRR